MKIAKKKKKNICFIWMWSGQFFTQPDSLVLFAVLFSKPNQVEIHIHLIKDIKLVTQYKF